MMNKEIQKGDRIFARLTMGGKPILEFMINTVESMEQLHGELRRMTAGLRGLVRLQVRNQSRGWMSMSNLMFYGEQARADGGSIFNIHVSPAGTPSIAAVSSSAKIANASSGRMAFPWDTH